mgnify:CR=1 FL=1
MQIKHRNCQKSSFFSYIIWQELPSFKVGADNQIMINLHLQILAGTRELLA